MQGLQECMTLLFVKKFGGLCVYFWWRCQLARIAAHKVNYNNNPILKWCLTNTGIQTDRNGNIVPVKNQSPRQRIDSTAALLDCYVGLYEHYNEYTGAI